MINDLISFLNASPVNFLAVHTLAARLEQAGYLRLDASCPLGEMKAGDKFFVTKNDSSLYAFRLGRKTLGEAGFRMICAHCDSPTFRIKPNAEMTCEGGITKLNTEVYGGPIMSTWFDRPLSLAGRVILRGKDALHPVTRLLHVKRPLLQISNLAIHFNRQVNDGVKLSKQKDMIDVIKRDGHFRPMMEFERVRKLSHKIISPGVKMGEGWLLPAEMVELIEENVPNIVLTQPFGCLPNHIAGKGMIRKIREIYPEANIVSVDYDPGASRINQENRIKLMLSNAK